MYSGLNLYYSHIAKCCFPSIWPWIDQVEKKWIFKQKRIAQSQIILLCIVSSAHVPSFDICNRSNVPVSGKRTLRSDCAFAQSDVSLRCPYMALRHRFAWRCKIRNAFDRSIIFKWIFFTWMSNNTFLAFLEPLESLENKWFSLFKKEGIITFEVRLEKRCVFGTYVNSKDPIQTVKPHSLVKVFAKHLKYILQLPIVL